MNKSQLIDKLKKELSCLPKEEIENLISFYSEMIDDRIEEGLSKNDAVAAIGDADDIIAQIKAEYPPSQKTQSALSKEQKTKKSNNKKLKAWAIILITLGSPIWLSLGIAAFVALISVYVVIWAVAGSLWSVPAALAGVSVGGTVLGIVNICYGNVPFGIALVGAATASAGLTIFAVFGCLYLTRLAVFLSKVMARGVASLFARKENTNA